MSQDGSNYFNNHHLNNSSDRYGLRELRRRSPNTTPASTVLNSPDLTEVHHYQHHQQHQIKVGRSPVGHQQDSNCSHPVTPESPVASGGNSCSSNIVFDDIGDGDNSSWRQYSYEEKNDESQLYDVLKITKIIGKIFLDF